MFQSVLLNAYYVANGRMECIINLQERYIFDNYTYEFGRLVKIDNRNYRVL